MPDRRRTSYTPDKDSIDRAGARRFAPLLKPGWSPEIMLNANYLTHACAMRTERMRAIGGWDPNTDGAQDWDLFLRGIGDRASVVHVPYVLYHWRHIETSVSANGFSAKPYAAAGQLRALSKYLPVAGWPGATPRFDGSSIRIVWNSELWPTTTVIIVGGETLTDLHLATETQGRVEVLVADGPNLPGFYR